MPLKFFSELTHNILLEIFNKQTTEELLISRALGPKQQMAADWILFSRLDVKSRECQKRLLEEWSFESTAMLQRRFTGKINSFEENLWLLLQNPSSDYTHRVLGLIFLAIINNKHSSINSDLFDSLIAHSISRQHDVRYNAFVVLSSLVSQFNKKQLSKYIDCLVNCSLKDSCAIVIHKQKELARLVMWLDEEQLKKLVDNTRRLIDDFMFYRQVQKNVAILAKKIKAEQITLIIEYINLQSDSKTLMWLLIFSKHMDSTFLEKFHTLILNELKTDDSSRIIAGLQVYSAMIQQKNQEHTDELDHVCTNLMRYDINTSCLVFTELTKLLNKMSLKQINLLFTFIITHIAKKSKYTLKIFNGALALVNYLTDQQLDALFNASAWVVNEQSYKKELIILCNIANQSNTLLAKQLIDLLNKKLTKCNQSSIDRTMATLILMSNSMTSELKKVFFDQLITTIQSVDCKHTLLQLTKSIHLFNNQQLVTLMPLLNGHIYRLNNQRRSTAHLFKSLGFIADRIGLDEFAILVDSIVDIIASSNWWTCKVKSYWISITKNMTIAQIKRLLYYNIESLRINQESDETFRALVIITTLFQYMDEEQLNLLAPLIASSKTDYGFLDLANKLPPKQLEHVFLKLMEQWDSEPGQHFMAILEKILIIAPKLTAGHLNIFWPKLIKLMNSSEHTYCDRLLNIICATKEQIDEYKLTEIISIIANPQVNIPIYSHTIDLFYSTFIPSIIDKSLILLINKHLLKFDTGKVMNALSLLIITDKYHGSELDEVLHSSINNVRLHSLLEIYKQVSANRMLLEEKTCSIP